MLFPFLNIINFEVFKYYFVRVTIIMMLKTGGSMCKCVISKFCELGDIIQRADEIGFEEELANFLESLGLIENSNEGLRLTKKGEYFLGYSPVEEESNIEC